MGAIAVTNPPYARIDAFIARTIALLDSGHLSAAVLLVRPDFVGTDGRAAYEWNLLLAAGMDTRNQDAAALAV